MDIVTADIRGLILIILILQWPDVASKQIHENTEKVLISKYKERIYCGIIWYKSRSLHRFKMVEHRNPISRTHNDIVSISNTTIDMYFSVLLLAYDNLKTLSFIEKWIENIEQRRNTWTTFYKIKPKKRFV